MEFKKESYRYPISYDSSGPQEYGRFYKKDEVDEFMTKLQEEIDNLKIQLHRWTGV